MQAFLSVPSFYSSKEKVIVLLIGLFVLPNWTCQAQSNPEALTTYLDRLMAPVNTSSSPGAAIVVVNQGRTIFSKGFGVANVEYDHPISPTNPFNVASVSKQFTAYAIALLATEGTFSLDDDIRRYVPELPDYGTQITIRHLLHHASGLRDYVHLVGLAGYASADAITQRRIMTLITGQKELEFMPGTEHRYSNTGYFLLAKIIERVTNQPFHEWMTEHLFEPLGMEQTRVYHDFTELVKGRATPYTFPDFDIRSTPRKAVFNREAIGASNVVTSASDLAKWMHHLSAPKQGEDAVATLLTQKGTLANGQSHPYGFGVEHDTFKDEQRIHHSGYVPGFRSYMAYYPERQFGIAVVSNHDLLSPFTVAEAISNAYLFNEPDPDASIFIIPEEVQHNTPDQGIALAPALQADYLGRYNLMNQVTFVISQKDGNLVFGIPGRESVPLYASEKDELYTERAKMSMQRDAQGHITGFILHQPGGIQMQVTRIGDLEPAKDQNLEQYVGTYYSPELQTSYTLVLEEGQLIVRHPRLSDLVIESIEEDVFLSVHPSFKETTFERDANNQILALRVGPTDSTRGIRFEKQ